MKKKIILRAALGFPIGITIGQLLSILFSLIWANGYYSPCEPELIAVAGSELGAVILQTLLCGLLGAGFSASSLIWEVEHWSLALQTGIYFGIISVIMMPIAYVTYWMEHSLSGFLNYLGIFVLIFVIIWVIQFMIGRSTVKKMNKTLSETRIVK